MWLMTKYGFFSIVCAWRTETDKRPHPELMMIRARCRPHLENLRGRFNALKDCQVTETQNTDYPYRILANKTDMAGVLSALLEEIDYCNFKSEIHTISPTDDGYQDFLMRVWAEGVNMQGR